MSDNAKCPGNVGAAAELKVCANLIELGFFVFRNVGPNGSVDLIALRNSRMWRIQVKSNMGNFHGCDILAVCRGDITYYAPDQYSSDGRHRIDMRRLAYKYGQEPADRLETLVEAAIDKYGELRP